MKNLIAVLIISCAALAQVPANVSVMMDETAAPEFKAFVWFKDVNGNGYYNLYREANPQGLNTSCPPFPSGSTPIQSGADNYFSDDPAPGLWQVPPTGQWRSKVWWCYAVSSVEDGVESPLSAPVAVAVADAFYVTLRYQTGCSGKIQVVSPYPYPNNQVVAHFYYTDSAGDHEFAVEHIYNTFDPSSPTEEWEGRLPIAANDGTLVPWVQGGKYRAVIVTPDGGNYTVGLAPLYNADASYYAQRIINRVQGGPDCPVEHDVPGGNYEWWQGVLK